MRGNFIHKYYAAFLTPFITSFGFKLVFMFFIYNTSIGVWALNY